MVFSPSLELSAVLAVMNNAVINFHVQVFVWMYVFTCLCQVKW